MIVEMKNAAILTLAKEKLSVLEKLRHLGVMHIKSSFRKESADASKLEYDLKDTEKLLFLFASTKAKGSFTEEMSGEEIRNEALALLEEKDLLSANLEKILQQIEKLRPWGDFHFAEVKKLEEKSIHIYFCSCMQKEFDRLSLPEKAAVSLVGKQGKNLYFAVVTQEKVASELLPTVPALPETPLHILEEQASSLQEKIKENNKRFAVLSLAADKVAAYAKHLASDLEFLQARDSMLSSGSVCCITGYVPVTALEALKEAAKENAWVLQIEDVDEDDTNIPTYIKKPAWLNLIDPLFDFIGITPGYRETDVSLFFLLAFPVFFGLLIGDAAYGTMFMATAFLCKYLFRKSKKAQLPLNLLILLSSFSILWGLLTGTCLGLPREKLPFFMQGLDFFAAPTKSALGCAIADRYGLKKVDGELTNRFTQFICFFIAAIHLISARLYRTFLEWPSWRCFGNVGWAILIAGNFFTAVSLIVFPGFFPGVWGYALYITGLILIAGTVTRQAVLNLPFDIIGSFVDVLSYIRLFAVGLSGLYVAQCFNQMAGEFCSALPPNLLVLGIIGLILIAVFGHVLNIMLGFLSVLVHAIRLNTLEFSNHIGLQWAGIFYRPFAEKKDEE